MFCTPIPSTSGPKPLWRRKPAQGRGYIDEPVTLIRKWGSSTDTAWYLQGSNYNVEALTDRTGSVIERYEYTPYGKPTVYTGAGTDGKWFTSDDVSSTVSAKGNNLLFQGRELDAETGNDYFRYRYYQPTLGRFVSRDPIEYDAGDINLFGFVENHPGVRVDPSGQISRTNIDLSAALTRMFGPFLFSDLTAQGKFESEDCPNCSKMKRRWNLEGSIGGSSGLGIGSGGHILNFGVRGLLKVLSLEIRPIVLRGDGNCDGASVSGSGCGEVNLVFGLDLQVESEGVGFKWYDVTKRTLGQLCYSTDQNGKIHLKFRKSIQSEHDVGGGGGFVVNASDEDCTPPVMGE